MNSIALVLFTLVLHGLYSSSTSNHNDSKVVTGQCATMCCVGQDSRDGLNGRDGQPGLTGRDGIKGNKGQRGMKGEAGPEGTRGFKGTEGDKGVPGYRGKRGTKGDHGVPGNRGKRGQKGEPGLQGTCNKTLLEESVKKLEAEFKKKIGDVMDLVLCPMSNATALGMNSGAIKDKQVNASTVYLNNHAVYGAHRARLNYKNWKGWDAKTLDVNQWLQISFQIQTIVKMVATQGYIAGEWVRTFQLSFSQDGSTWNIYQENGVPKTFTGNSDSSTVVKNKLQNPVRTYFIRFLPKTWNTHIGMRVEVYGCYV